MIEHVKSVSQNLIAETMAVDIKPDKEIPEPNVCLSDEASFLTQEERWRHTIRAFHAVDDKLCGGVEEFDARLKFAKGVAEEGLQQADKLRRNCDRNRWEMQDLLANCRVDKDQADRVHVPLAPFSAKQSVLIEGAIAVRWQKREQDLAEKSAQGLEAAQRAREIEATKAVIAAEVEEAVAAVRFGEKNSDDDQDEEDEEVRKRYSRGTRPKGLRKQGTQDTRFQRAGTPPNGLDGRRSLRSIVTSKLGKRSSRKAKAKSRTKSLKRGSTNMSLRFQESAEAECESPDSARLTSTSEAAEDASQHIAESDGDSHHRDRQLHMTRSFTDMTRSFTERGSLIPRSNTPTLPHIPPAAEDVQDILTLHSICLHLAEKTEKSFETCRALASRLGGHPLEPSRNHILNGDEDEKHKVKELMEALISGRKAWWHSRQSLSLRGRTTQDADISKESQVFEQMTKNLRQAARNDTE